MKVSLLILCLLLAAIAPLYSQQVDVDMDSLKVANAASSNPKIECPGKEQLGDTINLHVLVKPTSKKKQNEVGELLKSKNIEILYHEYFVETDMPLISIKITKAQFAEIFQGSVVYKAVQASASENYYCQMYVEKYKIPADLKHSIFKIVIPDPSDN